MAIMTDPVIKTAIKLREHFDLVCPSERWNEPEIIVEYPDVRKIR